MDYLSAMKCIAVLLLFLGLPLTDLVAKPILEPIDSIPDARLIYGPQLDSILNLKDDTTRVINFWATWCKPCVAELPVFFEVENSSVNQPVKFIYISLDFKRDLTGALRKFIQSRHLRKTILLLDEPDYNAWIDTVDPFWQGSIPATLVVNGHQKIRRFHEGELDAAGLKKLIGL